MFSQTPPSTPSDSLSWLQEQAMVMVGKLNLREEVIPSRYSPLHGMLRGRAITLHTHRFMGSVFRSLTLAYIRKQHSRELCSLTLIGLPTAKSLLPIVTIDLRAMTEEPSMVAVDLFPTDDRVYVAQAVPILQTLHDRSASCRTQSRNPTLEPKTYSPLALLCTAMAGQEGPLAYAIAHFLQQLTALAELSNNSCSHAERSQRAWQAQCDWIHREHDSPHTYAGMCRLFGEAASQRYLQQLLFEIPHS